jgi:hypothetical protein
LNDAIIVGREGIPGREKSPSASSKVIRLDEMIDSDQAIRIAYQSGVDEGYSSAGMRWDHRIGQAGTFAGDINYWCGEILEKSPRIIIAAKTGEVVHNDFLNPQE